jgi:glycosyltransferase involved in cell wall biosynthesis
MALVESPFFGTRTHRRGTSVVRSPMLELTVSRIAVIADFLEEKWPSMDLVAEELATHLSALPGVEGTLVRSPLRTSLGDAPPTATARALGRFAQLPLELSIKRLKADYLHIADHSYAHLALLFPRDRVGVFCHDIDAFRALLPGAAASPGRVLLARLLLSGMRHARIVFHSTQAVREEITRYGLVPASRLVQAPYGIAAEFLNAAPKGREEGRYLLHVGSCIPRKNVELLLQVFDQVRNGAPGIRLVQVGGSWTDAQRAIIDRRGLESHITQMRGISRQELAALYASASMVLVTSLAEGFGLPVIEALACGAPVVASDIPVLREVGVEGVSFCSLSDLTQWTRTVDQALKNEVRADAAAQNAVKARYSWLAHARTIAGAYQA